MEVQIQARSFSCGEQSSAFTSLLRVEVQREPVLEVVMAGPLVLLSWERVIFIFLLLNGKIHVEEYPYSSLN